MRLPYLLIFSLLFATTFEALVQDFCVVDHPLFAGPAGTPARNPPQQLKTTSSTMTSPPPEAPITTSASTPTWDAQFLALNGLGISIVRLAEADLGSAWRSGGELGESGFDERVMRGCASN
ncbi:hypothetical protein Salat_0643600 [Sesamum alatum]|uniref:Uncharacterized protein n=1 Tax=Sesamum alatum TaxID=300844 RepID=A0AAE2CUB4_9LAMI|nr:hypothetical protein Salat_0643600 [Sesamum alatum]